MATFEELIETVLLSLDGWNSDQGIWGTLHASLTDSATTFTVDGPSLPDGSGMSTGLLEVGDELVYVQALDRATGGVTGALRGWRGSTAAAHAAGTLVHSNPRFPRVAVKQSINKAITSVWPRLFATATDTFTVSTSQPVYTLTDADSVLSVSWTDTASTIQVPCRRYRFDKTDGTIVVADAMPGSTLSVTYTTRPVELTAGDDFTDSGLPAFCQEVIETGATIRMLQGKLSGSLPPPAMEQVMLAQTGYGQQGGGPGSVLKDMVAMYAQHLNDAERQLQSLYPPPVYYSW